MVYEEQNQRLMIAETGLLNHLMKNSESVFSPQVNEDLFVNASCKSIYNALVEVASSGEELTPNNVIASVADFGVDVEDIKRIYSFNVTSKDLDELVTTLKEEKVRVELENIHKRLGTLLGTKGRLKSSEISEVLDKGAEITGSIVDSSELRDMGQVCEDFLHTLEQRKSGTVYPYNDELLDKAIPQGAFPGAITVLGAHPGLGKTTFVLNLLDNAIFYNRPCMYFSLEMSEEAIAEKYFSNKLRIASTDFHKTENIDGICESIRQERGLMSKTGNQVIYSDAGLDIPRLRSYIREFKRRTGNDYALVIIDLLTMMHEFNKTTGGQSTANAYETTMNKLNELVKAENVHIFGVSQFRRPQEQLKINTEDKLDTLRPTKDDFKNSQALEERARVCLGLYRKKYYAQKYHLDNEDIPDVMEVEVLKMNLGNHPKPLLYHFDGEYSKLTPFTDVETERMYADNKLKEVMMNL